MADNEPTNEPTNETNETSENNAPEPPPAGDKATPEQIALCKRLTDQIVSEIDQDQELLWQLFVQYDTSMDASISTTELESMLKDFDPDSTETDRETYAKALDPNNDHEVSFSEFCKWWDVEKNNSHGTLGAKLTARFVAAKAQQYTVGLFGKSDFEKKLDVATKDQLDTAVQGYKQTLFEVRQYKVDKAVAAKKEEEEKRREEAKKVKWSEEERMQLENLFDRFVAESPAKKINTESELGRMALLMGYDAPASVILTSKEVFGDALDFETFLEWWACCPESKKIKRFGLF
eukprot:TRINITY_DN17896_c0_g1_i1.p1 TRINITY_DN17896_c0_g1~~TRINITY_DN17896_c0_g1_i1.p1  ORF type:complete len:303 (-),score=55.82 TRINITY_DN17896_c0_g1_i1:83-955(-)